MHNLAVVCMLLESELLGICIVYEHICVACKLISYMHRALIFNCAGREIVGSAVVMILQPLCVSIAICDTLISMQFNCCHHQHEKNWHVSDFCQTRAHNMIYV